jgi:hypothetical protein
VSDRGSVSAVRPLIVTLLALTFCQACSLFESERDESPPPVATTTTAPPVVPTGTAPPPPPVAPPAFDPQATGTRVLARYQNGGDAYIAVVTQQAGGGNVNVVYADGDAEALPASALSPDSIAEGSRVQARIRSWPNFHPGTLQRRIGHAVFVRFDDGDEQWTSIGLVRTAANEIPANAREAPLPPSTVPMGQVGAQVVANYQRAGWFYAGVVVETRADGMLHVIYADGDREWLAAADVRADSIQPGARVQAQVPRTTQTFEATVRRRVAHAVELQLDDGQKQWLALPNVRVRS